ncbi:MAG: CoA pyrophosphatase [Myxococcales bacterium]|nr:MAG: CoA pyrophosphatase [Myxococcales bacterium]
MSILEKKLPRTIPAHERLIAGVALVLRQTKSGSELLMIERAERHGDPWSGHMAFPGGRAQREDKTLTDTVLREVHEEIGWDLTQQAEYLGHLGPLPIRARGGLTGEELLPLVFDLREERDFVLNEEVNEVFWFPLQAFGSDDFRITFPYLHEGKSYDLPAYLMRNKRIWGLSYRMIQRLLG